MIHTPLLLTSAVNCDQNVPYVALKKHEERLFQTLCCLISWSQASCISPIVLCDNTQLNYDFSPIVNYAKKYGVELEVLTFKGNVEETKKRGKGYGEGEIIQYALTHSRHLQDANISFYKLTSRVFIPNFPAIHKQCNEFPTVFQKAGPGSSSLIKRVVCKLFDRMYATTPTIFYKCNVGFYRKYLLSASTNVNDRKNYYLEHAFYRALSGQKLPTFDTLPFFIGISGTSGKILSGDYVQNIKILAKKFLAAMPVGMGRDY